MPGLRQGNVLQTTPFGSFTDGMDPRMLAMHQEGMAKLQSTTDPAQRFLIANAYRIPIPTAGITPIQSMYFEQGLMNTRYDRRTGQFVRDTGMGSETPVNPASLGAMATQQSGGLPAPTGPGMTPGMASAWQYANQNQAGGNAMQAAGYGPQAGGGVGGGNVAGAGVGTNPANPMNQAGNALTAYQNQVRQTMMDSPYYNPAGGNAYAIQNGNLQDLIRGMLGAGTSQGSLPATASPMTDPRSVGGVFEGNPYGPGGVSDAWGFDGKTPPPGYNADGSPIQGPKIPVQSGQSSGNSNNGSGVISTLPLHLTPQQQQQFLSQIPTHQGAPTSSLWSGQGSPTGSYSGQQSTGSAYNQTPRYFTNPNQFQMPSRQGTPYGGASPQPVTQQQPMATAQQQQQPGMRSGNMGMRSGNVLQ